MIYYQKPLRLDINRTLKRREGGVFSFLFPRKSANVFQNNLTCSGCFSVITISSNTQSKCVCELLYNSQVISLSQKKVVEQLRKELLVKQEPELKPQTFPATADGKTVLLTAACPPSQPPTGPPHNQGAPQVPLYAPITAQFLDKRLERLYTRRLFAVEYLPTTSET